MEIYLYIFKDTFHQPHGEYLECSTTNLRPSSSTFEVPAPGFEFEDILYRLSRNYPMLAMPSQFGLSGEREEEERDDECLAQFDMMQ